LTVSTMHELESFLPPYWSHSNPIDILGDATTGNYTRVVDIALKDENTDGVLAIICPQGVAGSTRTADTIKAHAKSTGKPMLACWMGGHEVAAGRNILNSAGIPTFEFPDTAARVFQYMWRYSYNLKGLYETPQLTDPADAKSDSALARQIVDRARAAGRTLLT